MPQDPRLEEIEKEIAFQKKRLHDATQTAEEKIHHFFVLTDWIRAYPLQAASIFAAGGVALSQLFVKKDRVIDVTPTQSTVD